MELNNIKSKVWALMMHITKCESLSIFNKINELNSKCNIKSCGGVWLVCGGDSLICSPEMTGDWDRSA